MFKPCNTALYTKHFANLFRKLTLIFFLLKKATFHELWSASMPKYLCAKNLQIFLCCVPFMHTVFEPL